MNIEAFLVCDAATDQMGKLNILGAFDSIFALKFPAVHPSCAVVLRIRFSYLEKGDHKINIHFTDEDGKDILPPLFGNIQVMLNNDEQSVVTNFILNLQHLQFPHEGAYSVNLEVDDEEMGFVPITLKQR